jgi:hydroxymethylpyrimidine kinase/phosphomethylpyrimidine kinase
VNIPNNFYLDTARADSCAVGTQAPLVHSVTNLVVTASNADVLLAAAASPTMAYAIEEVADLARKSGAVVVNIGTLDSHWFPAMQLAVCTASQAGKPSMPDPVRLATSGGALITLPMVRRLRQQLFGACTLIAPNLDEVGPLVGRRIDTLDDALDAEQTSADQGTRAVLVNGGHLQTTRMTDALFHASGVCWQRSAPSLTSRNLHAKGRSLCAAIATLLAPSLELMDAVAAAHRWLRCALRLGSGHVPLNHFYNPLSLIPLENSHA